jgi:nicotinamide mononucleotide transporter
MSPLEIIGVVLGVLMVLLFIRESIWAWPVGLVDSGIYVWIYFSSKLYSDTILQVVYCVIFAYGWWHWARGGGTAEELPVTRLSRRSLLGWIAIGAVATAGWGELMHRKTDAAFPHWDAFILVFGLIAQWWQARKRLENWIAWIIVDGVGIGIYWLKDLRPTAALYALYLAMAVAGHLAWRKSLVQAGKAADARM